jgi:hypothetical protein
MPSSRSASPPPSPPATTNWLGKRKNKQKQHVSNSKLSLQTPQLSRRSPQPSKDQTIPSVNSVNSGSPSSLGMDSTSAQPPTALSSAEKSIE